MQRHTNIKADEIIASATTLSIFQQFLVATALRDSYHQMGLSIERFSKTYIVHSSFFISKASMGSVSPPQSIECHRLPTPMTVTSCPCSASSQRIMQRLDFFQVATCQNPWARCELNRSALHTKAMHARIKMFCCVQKQQLHKQPWASSHRQVLSPAWLENCIGRISLSGLSIRRGRRS